MLIHLLRGAGTDGLAGIPPVRPLHRAPTLLPDDQRESPAQGGHGLPAPPANSSEPGAHPGELPGARPSEEGAARALPGLVVIRPLIETWRSAVEAFCRAEGLEPRLDESNLSREFLRNRVRLDLLPYLRREFGEEVRANLQRLTWLARPEVEFLEESAGHTLAGIATPLEEGLALSAPGLMALPLALRRRAVRRALRQVKGDPEGIGFGEIERVLQAAGMTGKAQFDLPGPVRVRKQGASLHLFRPAAPEPAARRPSVSGSPPAEAGAGALPALDRAPAEAGAGDTASPGRARGEAGAGDTASLGRARGEAGAGDTPALDRARGEAGAGDTASPGRARGEAGAGDTASPGRAPAEADAGAHPVSGSAPDEAAASPLPVPGRAAIPGGGAVEVDLLDRPPEWSVPRVPRAREVFLDADAIQGPLSVRAWRNGDRFTPLGLAGGKSLHKLFIEAGVPAGERRRVPVVTDARGILWVAGVAIADRAKVTPETRRLLRLRRDT